MNSLSKNWEEVIKKAEVEEAEEKIAEAEAEFVAEESKTSAQAPKQKAEQVQKAPAAVETSTTAAEDQDLDQLSYADLTAKLASSENLANKYWSDLLRMKAEMENFQRRADRDIANARKYSVEKIAAELLAVVDNLERCLEHKTGQGHEEANSVFTGVELTLKMFLEVLQKFGITSLNPVGEIFNPDYHTAMLVREEAGAKPNTVLQVVQKGYMLKDRLLRPAMVVVAKQNS